MNFFRTDAEVRRRKEIEEKAVFIRKGGSLRVLKPAEVHELQTYALDIKDVKLYDYLEKFWKQA